MAVVQLRKFMEKDEHGRYHAVIKFGGYATPDLADNMGTAMMMILQDAMNGMTTREQLPRQVLKDYKD